MDERKLFVFIGSSVAGLAFLVFLFYANLVVVNAIRRWMPNEKWRLRLLAGSEEVPTIREHFSTATLAIARFALCALALFVFIAVSMGMLSTIAALPIWALLILLIVLFAG